MTTVVNTGNLDIFSLLGSMEPLSETSNRKILLKRIIIRIILWILTLGVVGTLAVVLYVSFYLAYIPNSFLTTPVHLLFSTDCNNGGHGLCSFPSANVSLLQQQRQERILMRGQPYIIHLNLEMPDSPVNQKLGMFLVKADFYTDSGQVIETSSRSCMLHYQSWMVQYLRTMVFFIPLVFGWAEEKQNVHILLFDRYMDNTYHPASSIHVIVMAKNIEIYSASISFEANFSGIRYIMYNWPVTSAAIAIGLNILTLCFIASLAHRKSTVEEVVDLETEHAIPADSPSTSQSETSQTNELSQEDLLPPQSVQDIPEQTGIGVTTMVGGRIKMSPIKRKNLRKKNIGKTVVFLHSARPWLRCQKFSSYRSRNSLPGDSESHLSPEEDSIMDEWCDDLAVSSSEKRSIQRGLHYRGGTDSNLVKQSTCVTNRKGVLEFYGNSDTKHSQKHHEGHATYSSEDSFVKDRRSTPVQGMFSLRETKSESCLSDLKHDNYCEDSYMEMPSCTLFNLSSLYCTSSVSNKNRDLQKHIQSGSCERGGLFTRKISCTKSEENLGKSSMYTSCECSERSSSGCSRDSHVENKLLWKSCVEKDEGKQELRHRNMRREISF